MNGLQQTLLNSGRRTSLTSGLKMLLELSRMSVIGSLEILLTSGLRMFLLLSLNGSQETSPTGGLKILPERSRMLANGSQKILSEHLKTLMNG